MRLKNILMMIWENMKQRKLRTSLTTLGVVIGITAIIALASLGEGFRIAIKQRMEQGFELDVLTVIPGSLFAGFKVTPFTDEEIAKVRNVTHVKTATAVIQMGNVTLRNKTTGEETKALVATAVNFSEFIDVFPDRFTFETIQGEPEQWGNNSVVIGYKVNYNETLTPFAKAGDNITLTINTRKPPFFRNYNFTVAGTLQEKGTPGLTNFDYWVFLPIEIGREVFFENHGMYGAHLIYVKVSHPDYSEAVADDIEKLFPAYQISILVPTTFLQQTEYILNMVQIFLTSIASIALFVAGIGIMNITSVSVMERTREIGILKAIGAKNKTILTMFLAETLLIGIAGGLIGVPTGYGLSYFLNFVLSHFIPQEQQNPAWQSPETRPLEMTPVFSIAWTIGAVAFGIIICLVFSWYPARKAAKLDPVEALRYE